MAKSLGGELSFAEARRIDLLRLKGYLTCFPERIVVAPKVKHLPVPDRNGETTKRVDQVWLIDWSE